MRNAHKSSYIYRTQQQRVGEVRKFGGGVNRIVGTGISNRFCCDGCGFDGKLKNFEKFVDFGGD